MPSETQTTNSALPAPPQDNGPRRDDLNSESDQISNDDSSGDQRLSERNSDLHGFAPDSCPVALLIIDLINDMEFEGGETLYEATLPLTERVRELRDRCRTANVPVVYVNDNFGRWQSDFQSVVRHVLDGERSDGEPLRGRDIALALEPGPQDYFVLKPKHSGFYSTTLDLLLKYLGTRTLILCGVAGDICVLFTANDAYMREFDLVVPSDGIASESPERNALALEIMAQVLKARTPSIAEINLDAMLKKISASG